MQSSPFKAPAKYKAIFTSSVAIAFIVVAICASLFAKLADSVHEQHTTWLDDQILLAINHRASPWLNDVIPTATDVGGVIGIAVLSTTAIAYFLRQKDYRHGALVVWGILGGVALNLLLKSLFMRHRPDLWAELVHETGYSFPSGHSMMSATFAVIMIVAFWNTRWRWLAIVLGALYTGFVGFSRLYLGVHYPTDVLGGWLIATAWVLALALVIRYFFPVRRGKA